MSYKSILVAASGGSASAGAIALACRLAQRFAAHLEGFHARVDPYQAFVAVADGFGAPWTAEVIDRFTADIAELAAKTKAAFSAAVKAQGLADADRPAQSGATASWREETGYAPELVAARARFFDLAVLGRSERVIDQPHSDAVEQTLLRSGRPVLLAPATVPAVIGERIALGWNGSPEAVRVIAGALPLLAAAKTVTLITVGDKHRASGREMTESLAWRGIAAKHVSVAAVSGVGAGEQLLAAARDGDADLLAMGGYGHGLWRETLFGGATREVVGASLLPILLAH